MGEAESPPGIWRRALLALATVVAWELAKRLWASLFAKSVVAAGANLVAAATGQFLDLPVPAEPHVEIAVDPPCGLHHSNSREPYSFETETTRGTYVFFHPPTGPNTTTGPNGFDYLEYFQCKSRLWEIRIHLQFKKAPPPGVEFFFGIELAEYVPLSRATLQAQRMIVAGIRQAVGGLYQTPGEDPRRTQGEVERPSCVLPLWAFDQFIETPPGEKPPSLVDPHFSQLGKKRYKRIAAYSEEIRQLQSSFRVGPTYTFAFWGNSRFLDVLNWTVIGIPLVTPIDFDRFAGKPPVHVVLYALSPNPGGGKAGDQRHVQSRKMYYFRAAIWSSSRRPDKATLEALTGARTGLEAAMDQVPKKVKSLRRRFAGFVRNLDNTMGLTACTQRGQ